jgi:hypothetical protein
MVGIEEPAIAKWRKFAPREPPLVAEDVNDIVERPRPSRVLPVGTDGNGPGPARRGAA